MKIRHKKNTKILETHSKKYLDEGRVNMITITEWAKEVIGETGQLSPQAFVEVKKKGEYGQAIIGMVFSGRKEKELMMKSLGKFVNEISESKRYIVAFEGWMTMIEKGSRPFIEPSRDVNRKEAIILMEFRKGYDSMTRTILFERKGEQVNFLEQMDSIGEGNSFWNVFTEEEGKKEKFSKYAENIDVEFLKRVMKNLKDKGLEKRYVDAKSEEERKQVLKETFEFLEKEKERIDKMTFEDVEDK